MVLEACIKSFFLHVFPKTTSQEHQPLVMSHNSKMSKMPCKNTLNLFQHLNISYRIFPSCLDAEFQVWSYKSLELRQKKFRPPRPYGPFKLAWGTPCLLDRFLTLLTRFKFRTHADPEVSCMLSLRHRDLVPRCTHVAKGICFCFHESLTFVLVHQIPAHDHWLTLCGSLWIA